MSPRKIRHHKVVGRFVQLSNPGFSDMIEITERLLEFATDTAFATSQNDVEMLA